MWEQKMAKKKKNKKKKKQNTSQTEGQKGLFLLADGAEELGKW